LVANRVFFWVGNVFLAKKLQNLNFATETKHAKLRAERREESFCAVFDRNIC
jgi:hypothetical protein